MRNVMQPALHATIIANIFNPGNRDNISFANECQKRNCLKITR